MTINCIKETVFRKHIDIKNLVNCESSILIEECKSYLQSYKELCIEVLGFKNPFLLNKEKIAESIYYKTFSDYNKKIKNITYYRGNCSAFNVVFTSILDRLENNNIHDLARGKLRALIQKHIFDSLCLINDYQKNHNDDPFFDMGLTRVPDYSLYYDACEAIIFGENHFEDPSDSSEISPALIRVMIELRLKWSMGLSAFWVEKRPGTMSEFIEVYENFIKNDEIQTSLDIKVIKRIYEWGNLYIHSGVRSYAWLTGFVMILLDPLFYGESHRMSGVRVTSLATIYEFWDALKNTFSQNLNERKKEIDIIPYKPGFICTDKNSQPLPCRNHYSIYDKSLKLLHENQDNYDNRLRSAYEMKCILQEGVQTIGSSLYQRVKSSYVSLREEEIRVRAYYLWQQRGMPLCDAERDWDIAIEHDIAFHPQSE